MSTRHDARRSYQRTALDRHSTTLISLVLIAIVVGGLVFAGLVAKSEVDAFVSQWENATQALGGVL